MHKENLLQGEKIRLTALTDDDLGPISRWYQDSYFHEGTFREHLRRDGRRYDMYLYGILRHEWAQTKSTSWHETHADR